MSHRENICFRQRAHAPLPQGDQSNGDDHAIGDHLDGDMRIRSPSLRRSCRPWRKAIFVVTSRWRSGGVGATFKTLRRGDRVVVPFTISCGTCFFCRKQMFSLW